MKRQLLLTAAVSAALGVSAETVDFDKITHWAGEGPNKAALVVSLVPGDGQKSPGVPVWGYRWADGENPTCFDMMTAIASESDDLLVLVQNTGEMGYTLNGLGYSRIAEALVSNIVYDFDGAVADDRISFGFYEPNKAMSQTSAPGGDTPALVAAAIDDAKSTHVIYHPLDVEAFGYPAYDYDRWTLDREACDDPSECYWNAGWYDGYWSYWTGDADLDNLAYSPLGMSSVSLHDGEVHAWKYNDFGGVSSEEWEPLEYVHTFASTTGVESIDRLSAETASPVFYRIDGTRLARRPDAPGVYIMVRGSVISKISIR